MDSHAPRRANFIRGLLPAAGAFTDAVFAFLHPAVTLNNASVAGGPPAGLHNETNASLALTDPSFVERALTAAPGVLWAIGLAVMIALPALTSDEQPAPARFLFTGSFFILAGVGAVYYADHYFGSQPYHGELSRTGFYLGLGLILCFVLQTVTRAEQVTDLKGKLERVV